MRFSIGCLLLVLCASVAGAQDYGTLTLSYLGRDPSHSKGNGGRFDWNVVALSPNANWDSDWSQPTAASTLFTFCMETQQFIASTTFEVNALTNAPKPGAGSTMSATRAGYLEILADNYFQIASTGTVAQAAAFQLAVWDAVFSTEIAYDFNASTNPISGPSGYSAADVNNATTLLANI